jgi:hypothetical protein
MSLHFSPSSLISFVFDFPILDSSGVLLYIMEPTSPEVVECQFDS